MAEAAGSLVKTLRESFGIVITIMMVIAAGAFGLGFLAYMGSKIVPASAQKVVNATIYFSPITSNWGTLTTILIIGGVMALAVPTIAWMVQKFRSL